jgi:uncharacterized protein
MFLSVKELEVRKVSFDETFAPGKIDFTEEDLVQGSPLLAVGTAEMVEESEAQIHVQGQYSVEMTAQCDRCLGSARFPLKAGFDLYYRPASDIAREEEIELDEGEVELAFYEGKGLELEDILREQILLALPMQRVCSEACKGICPVCGKNRNESACECRVEPAKDLWGALRNLELK